MVSSSLIILSIQISMSFILSILGISWYILPRIQQLKKDEKLSILLWVHVFRYAPLVLLVRSQTTSDLPHNTLEIIAIGDFISAIVALIAILVIRYYPSFSNTSVWVFQIVSTIDILSALTFAMKDKLYDYSLGFNWFILTFYVPLVIVSQIFMVRILMQDN